MKDSAGFTLLEILVVLTIMGFLLAMLAPRLAGIGDNAVGTVCDSNATRAISMMGAYHEQTGRMPDMLTNIVVQDGTDWAIPTVSDGDPGNGAETLAQEFNDRNQFKIHILTEDEANEMRGMGVVTVLNLNDYSNNTGIAAGDRRPAMAEQNVAADIGVAMIGIGAENSDPITAFTAPGTERGWGDPDLIGRIILGMGPENGLITSGLVANAAHCPGGLRNTDNAVYNDYNIVLPRLASTVAKGGYASGVVDADGDADNGLQVAAVQYETDAGLADPYVFGLTGQLEKTRTITLDEAQEAWQYTVLCPEGHMYPADDYSWGINFDGGTPGQID